MSKTPRSVGPGPTPSSKALLGSGSSGTTRNRKFRAASGTPAGMGGGGLDPSKTGSPDVVQLRENVAMQGKMLHNQLKSNKSKGIGALGSPPSGGKPRGGPRR